MAQLYSSVRELIHRTSAVSGPELGALVGSLALPAVGFESKPRPTTSFRGGAAPLPADSAWPELDGVPLDFLASFDLGRVPEISTWESKPSVGSLAFFVLPQDHDDYGALNGTEGFGQVILSAGLNPAEREHPTGAAVERRYLKPTEPMWSLPPSLSPATDAALSHDSDAIEAYAALSDKLWAGRLTGVDSQLLGYPDPWQTDPTADAEVRLLAEIGDVVGSYFFTISDADLAALEFGNVSCVWQCD